jgi:hypothetical protein
MSNNRLAFKFLEDEEKVPIGYIWIRCHMIFDVKMDFTRKARYVAGGHMTDPPVSITYSSVVSQDSVRIAFVLAALNDINVLATDIGNAYLNAHPRERVYTTAGPEFGPELQGKHVLIVRALYGLKSMVLLGDRIYRTLFIVWDVHHVRQIRMFGFEPRLKMMASIITNMYWFTLMIFWYYLIKERKQ